jgi:hypothetical protein
MKNYGMACSFSETLALADAPVNYQPLKWLAFVTGLEVYVCRPCT